VLLGDVLKHVLPDQKYEQLYPQLQSMLVKVISHIKSMT
jgi:hypothetical protein